MTTETQSYRRQDRSLRFTFRYEGEQIRLVDRREVDAVTPPSEDLERPKPAERSGFWLELQDREGRVLYRRVIRHPVRANAEVATGDGGFTNEVSVAERGSFSLVVPNLSPAADLALFASPLDRPNVPEPASEIVRVPLRDRPPRPRPQEPGTAG